MQKSQVSTRFSTGAEKQGDLATQGVQFVHGEKGKSIVFTQYHGQFCGIKEMIMMPAVVILCYLFPIDSKK